MIFYKKINEMSGIYCIENIDSGRFYIGSTVSFDKRWYSHYWALKNQVHCNNHLQNGFNKYGEQSFRMFVLECCEENILLEREQKYFDVFLYAQQYIQSDGKDKRFLDIGYNLTPTAGHTTGYKHPEELLQKFSETTKGLWQDLEYIIKQTIIRTPQWHIDRIKRVMEVKNGSRREEILQKMSNNITNSIGHQKLRKSVLLYSRMTGEFIKECESITACAVDINTEPERVGVCLKGKIRYIGDYIVRYKIDDNYPLQIEPVTQRYKSEQIRKNLGAKIVSKNGKTILRYDFVTKQLLGEHDNANKAGKELGIHSAYIRATLYNQREHINGYVFKYKDYQKRTYNKQSIVSQLTSN